MAVLEPERITELLQPYIDGSVPAPRLRLPDGAIPQIATYLDLLVRWNARVSLTSIRTPEEIVRRHFGEGLFVAAVLADRVADGSELLDFGSGGGFPGLPIQIVLPALRVTLAESQARKVTFLREVVRTLGLAADVWPQRVEAMPDSRRFQVVTMRAVDRMPQMVRVARARVAEGGLLASLVGGEAEAAEATERYMVPGSERRYLLLERVPRGTQP